MMSSDAQEFHVALFPFMGHGHMIPTLDIAKLFAVRGVKAIIITTPVNVPTFSKAIENDLKISLEVIRFPAQEVGLPEGCENMDTAVKHGLYQQFLQASESEMLINQVELYLLKARPRCLIADMFFPWATDSAAKFNIPRLVFHGTSYFALCVQEIIRLHKPHHTVSSDDESFVVPFLPHAIELTRLQLPYTVRDDEDYIGDRIKESELRSNGVIVNSFFELEPDYANFFSKDLGRKAWHIGPVALCNRRAEDTVHSRIHEWLSSRKPDSVIYICFGSSVNLIAPQLKEIALALESSEQEFIWVVRNSDDLNNEEWLPAGFEQRVENKGLIIKGWAPQVLILNHEAIGAFVTHCGWNSTLEGISAGVPMLAWPVFAEQFYNEKLVTEILKIGISIGAKKWMTVPSTEDVLKRDAIEKALREIMVGDEAKERRYKAKMFKEMARKAVEEGGSSYSDLTALIEELKVHPSA